MAEIKINSNVTKAVSLVSGIVLVIVAVLTYFKNQEELAMKREQHLLDKELAQLNISSLKYKSLYGTDTTT
jgi:hypothetical protein